MKIVVSIGTGFIFFSILLTGIFIGIALMCPIYKTQYEYMKKGQDLENSNYTARISTYYFNYYTEFDINPKLGSSIYNQIKTLDFNPNLASSKLLDKYYNQQQKQLYINNTDGNSNDNDNKSNNRTNNKILYNASFNYLSDDEQDEQTTATTISSSQASTSYLFEFLMIFSYLGKVLIFLKLIPLVLIVCRMSLTSFYRNTPNQRSVRSIINFIMLTTQFGIVALLMTNVLLLLYIPNVFKSDEIGYRNNIISSSNSNINGTTTTNTPISISLFLDTCLFNEKDPIYFGKCKSFSGHFFNLDKYYNAFDYRWGPSKSWFLFLVSTIIDFITLIILSRMFLYECFFSTTTIHNNHNPNNRSISNNNNNQIEMNQIKPSKMVMLNIEIKSEQS